MTNGIRTARLARTLQEIYAPRGFDVLFDHGVTGQDASAAMGKIAVWFGAENSRNTCLAELDIAVVQARTNRVYALIEIEETPVAPKQLLGDVLATLLGERISFTRNRSLQVGPWTTLLVLVQAGSGAQQTRMDFLSAQLKQIQSGLTTANASIGKIVLCAYRDEAELENLVRREIDAALVQAAKKTSSQ
ncbi:MAG: hypothetical protein HY741_17360 [Chloroflexi bacterium]|nr:hypothetical protein [Chloroflexota bacterium]